MLRCNMNIVGNVLVWASFQSPSLVVPETTINRIEVASAFSTFAIWYPKLRPIPCCFWTRPETSLGEESTLSSSELNSKYIRVMIT